VALLVSTKKKGAGTSPSIDTTGATLLVAVRSDAADAASIPDSKSNTWQKLNVFTGSFSSVMSIFYVENPTVGTGHTFDSDGVTPSICVAAFSGVVLSLPFDQQNGQNEGSSPRSTGSVTPTEHGELLIAAAGGFFAAGSINLGFTLLESNNLQGGVNFGTGLAYLEQITAAPINPAWTTTSGSSTAIATFKTGGSPPPPFDLVTYIPPDLRRWNPVAY